MSSFLHMSSWEWENKERRKQIEQGTRRHRLIELHKGGIFIDYYVNLQASMSDPGSFQHLPPTVSNASAAFRLYSSAACYSYTIGYWKYLWFPYKLFDLLDEDESPTAAEDNLQHMFMHHGHLWRVPREGTRSEYSRPPFNEQAGSKARWRHRHIQCGACPFTKQKGRHQTGHAYSFSQCGRCFARSNYSYRGVMDRHLQ